LLNSEIKENSAKIEMSKELVDEKNKSLKELEEKEKQVKEWEKEIKFLEYNITSLNIFQKSLENTQIMLREEFTRVINAGLDDLWNKLYPYDDFISLKLGIINKDYALQLKSRDGTWVNVEGITSGGERSSACLTLRVAFALVLTQNLSWLVLDEPTHNLDRQGIQGLSSVLRDHIPQLVDQVFIITHEEELESAVSGSLYKLDRNKAVDEPTKATLVSSQ
jgi:exonuclease SbcC